MAPASSCPAARSRGLMPFVDRPHRRTGGCIVQGARRGRRGTGRERMGSRSDRRTSIRREHDDFSEKPTPSPTVDERLSRCPSQRVAISAVESGVVAVRSEASAAGSVRVANARSEKGSAERRDADEAKLADVGRSDHSRRGPTTDRERGAGQGDPDLGGPDRSDLRRGDAQEQERGTPDGAQVRKQASGSRGGPSGCSWWPSSRSAPAVGPSERPPSTPSNVQSAERAALTGTYDAVRHRSRDQDRLTHPSPHDARTIEP